MNTESRQSVLNDALRLSPEDRAAVARALLESIHDQIDPSIESEWRAEKLVRVEVRDV